jgi:hypothetical protein
MTPESHDERSHFLFPSHPTAGHLAGTAGWCALPHALIWGVAVGLISSTASRPQCVGFCAVYSGWVTYGTVLGAVLLSAVVALTQLFLLSR